MRQKIWLFFILVMLCCLLSCTYQVKEYPVIEDPLIPLIKDLRELEIASSPRYQPATGYENHFILTVFNGLAHKIRVNISAKEHYDIGPGSQADIPFDRDWSIFRFIALSLLVLDGQGKVIGTETAEIRIPPRRGNYRGIYGDVWHVIRARPLRQL